MPSFSPANKFSLVIGIGPDSEKYLDFSRSVVEVNIPGCNLGLLEQPTSIRAIHRPGDSLDFNDVTATFLVSEELTEWISMLNWILHNRNATEFRGDVLELPMCLTIMTNSNLPAIRIQMEGCFPYILSDINYSVQIDTIQRVTSSVTFKVQSISVETV
jgi:hypothetical protein